MKVVAAALVVVLLAWVILMVAATTTSSEINGGGKRPTPTRSTPPPNARMTFDLGSVTEAEYSNELIATLRTQLQGSRPNFKFGIPMLGQFPPSEYIYIKLISAQGNSIELAIEKKDIYVVGYSSNKEANCFKDIFNKGNCLAIFRGAQDPVDKHRNIGIDGNYEHLESRAGAGRRDVQLGMNALGGLINKISKPSTFTQRDEARLLLVAIQMIPEAVRFKYIENQVIANFYNYFNPNYKVISLENSWDKLSRAIAGATSAGIFKDGTTVRLKDAQGNDWVVTNVNDIQNDMGLLNYVGGSQLPKWPLDDNVPVSAQSITSLLATM